VSATRRPRVASAWRDGIALMPGLRNPPFLLIAP
jgi:hypothetical protein